MITEKLQKKIDRAIRLLQSVQKRYDGEIEIAYSGGKDSDVILQLAKEAGIRYRAIYRNTTIDPPGTITHVERMGAEILRPKETFFQLVAKKGFPNRFSRFCCEKLKEYKVMDKCIMGVRKSESSKRNERYNEPTECRFYGRKTEANHVEAIYPILDWTDDDVLAFVEDRHLTLAPVYYTSRVGGANRRVETSRLYVLPTRHRAQAHPLLQGLSTYGTSLPACWATLLGQSSRRKGSPTLRQRVRMVCA